MGCIGIPREGVGGGAWSASIAEIGKAKSTTETRRTAKAGGRNTAGQMWYAIIAGDATRAEIDSSLIAFPFIDLYHAMTS